MPVLPYLTQINEKGSYGAGELIRSWDKSAFNNNPTCICPSVQLQVAEESVLELLLYSAICQEQLPEDLHLHNAPATPSGVKFKTEPKPILLLQTETQGAVCTQTLRTFLTQARRKKERRVKHSSSCSCGLKLWTWRIILEKKQLSSAVQNWVHQELIPDQLVQYTLLMETNTSC